MPFTVDNASDPVLSPPVSVTGATDVVQLTVKGNSTQTSNIVAIQNSSATSLLTIDNSGNEVVAGYIEANNVALAYNTTATSAATTTMVVGDKYLQYWTGATTHTVKMPVVSTLPYLGFPFKIVNLSSGVVTVQSSGANTIQAMATNTQLMLTAILITGTATASWDWVYGPVQAGITGSGSLVMSVAPSFTGIVTIGSGTATQHVLNTLVKTNGAQVGTLTNAPSAGNPTGFAQITVNGTTSYIPYWQ